VQVYTAVFDNYDRLEYRTYFSEEAGSVQHTCFSDRRIDRARGWNVIVGEPPVKGSSKLKAKWFKVNSHILFPDGNSLYMDGNYRLTKNPDYLDAYITKGGKDRSSDLVLFRHYRNNLKEEFEICLEKKGMKPLWRDIRRQSAVYEKDHDLENLTLYHGSVLVRGPGAKSFNEMWWEHISEYSMRDQLSLALVAHITKVNYSVFPGPLLDASCIVRKAFKHNDFDWVAFSKAYRRYTGKVFVK